MPSNVLAKLFDAAGGVCTYCDCDTYMVKREAEPDALRRFGIPDGLPGTTRALRYREASREHVVRSADGGRDDIGNLTLACTFCNTARGEATPEHHRAAMLLLIAAELHPNHQAEASAMLERRFRPAFRAIRSAPPVHHAGAA